MKPPKFWRIILNNFLVIFEVVVVSALLVWLFIVLCDPVLDLSRDILISVFSSIAQGFVGLVAFLGAVAFFALESNENKLLRIAHQQSDHQMSPYDVLSAHHAVIEEHSEQCGGKIGREEYIDR